MDDERYSYDRSRLQPDAVYMRDGRATDASSVDCSTVRPTTAKNEFSPVVVTGDVFINGVRPARRGIYCVRDEAYVTRCNTATSVLVAADKGRWSCHPKWPALFGGEDGSDILACGGRLSDGTKSYEFRLPPSDRIDTITDPYEEAARFKCTPGEYVNGPRDHMNNEYIPLANNRFHRIRNNCAKYVANSGVLLAPVSGNGPYCNCLATHGRLRRHHDTEPNRATRIERETRDESHHNENMFQVSYACSPCIASGDLIATEGVFNFPVGCTKYNQTYFNGRRLIDIMPCGLNGFASASEPSCVNAWIYVGDEGTSPLVKRATARLTP